MSLFYVIEFLSSLSWRGQSNSKIAGNWGSRGLTIVLNWFVCRPLFFKRGLYWAFDLKSYCFDISKSFRSKFCVLVPTKKIWVFLPNIGNYCSKVLIFNASFLNSLTKLMKIPKVRKQDEWWIGTHHCVHCRRIQQKHLSWRQNFHTLKKGSLVKTDFIVFFDDLVFAVLHF